MPPHIYKKFIWSGAILGTILAVGTTGYWFIGGGRNSLIDALYMTVITVTTIGYGEIVDLSGNAGGRIFTMLIAVSGVGVMLYVITNVTALVVEGEISESLRRRRMERMANRSQGHYIVCGVGSVGMYVVGELRATRHPHVVVDINKAGIDRVLGALPDTVYVEGDATDAETLTKAGAENARGLFAVTGDDNQNLVVCLTAKQLNPRLRVVSRCNEISHSNKRDFSVFGVRTDIDLLIVRAQPGQC